MTEPFDETGLPDDFLKWEYTLGGRSHAVWATVARPLIRAADQLWKRAQGANQLWSQGFRLHEDGSWSGNERSLTGDEVESLHDRGLDGVALLLLGLAIENVAKSILVKREAEKLVTKEGEFRLKTHDLVDLLTRCKFSLTAAQQRHLTVVRDYVEWLGRYPIPLGAVGDRGPKSMRGAWVHVRMGPRTETWAAVRPLLDAAIEERDR